MEESSPSVHDDTSPKTVLDDPLPSKEEVRSYSKSQLLHFVQPFLDKVSPDEQASFRARKFNGESFLVAVDLWPTYSNIFGLEGGSSTILFGRARNIVGSGHLGKRSGEQARPTQVAKKPRFSAEIPSDIMLERFARLRSLLWGRGASLRDVVFAKKTVSVPEFSEDGITNATSVEVEFSELLLDTAIEAHLRSPAPGSENLNRADWEGLLPCQSNSLLFRDAYREMLGCIVTREKAHGYTSRDSGAVVQARRVPRHKAFIITGQPGIGKTWFMSLVLVDRLMRGEVTILQDGTEDAVVFDETGVNYLSGLSREHLNAVARNVEVWALADPEPRGIVGQTLSHEWFVLVTSSPRLENFKAFRKRYPTPLYYMQVWSWAEIAFASGTDNLENLHILWTLFVRYGPVARTLLHDIELKDITPRQLKWLVRSYNDSVDAKLDYILRQGVAHVNSQFNNSDSHTLFLLLPNIASVGRSVFVRSQTPCDDDKYKHISLRCFRRIITPMVGVRLGELACEKASYKGRELYEWMLGNPQLLSAAGWVFEGRAHGVLGQGGRFPCRTLTATAPKLDLELKCSGSSDFHTTVFANLRNLGERLRAGKGLTTFNREFVGIYWTPELYNLGGIDSLAILFDPRRQPRAILFQLTISANHGIDGKALAKVWDVLPNEIKQVPPAIVFVVPMQLCAAYRVQVIDIAGLDVSKCNPAEWPQFVLGLDDKILWDRIPGRRDTLTGRQSERQRQA